MNVVSAMRRGTHPVVTRGETMAAFDAFEAAFDDVPSVPIPVAKPA